MSGPREGWVPLVVQGREKWTELLESFTWSGWETPFKSGQYVTIAAELDGEWVERHYSIASRSGDQLELFLTLVPEGRLTPHLYKMNAGDQLWCWPNPRANSCSTRSPTAATCGSLERARASPPSFR